MTCGRGCGSTDNWDVRCCCEPDCPSKNSNEMLLLCPMRISTMCFHIGNNSNNWFYSVEKGDWSFLDKYCFPDADVDEIKQTYLFS